MEPQDPKWMRAILATVLGLFVAFLGFATLDAGQRVVAKWSSISAAYAVCGLAWNAAGATMMIGGLWTLLTLGRSRLPIRLGAAASLVAGIVLVVGTLRYVIPCSGPS